MSVCCTAGPIVRYRGQWMAALCATVTVSLAYANQLPLPRCKVLLFESTRVSSAIASTQTFTFLAHSKNELIQWRGVRRLSVCLSVRPSVCKLLRKSLLLARKWPDRHQTCIRWTPGQRAAHPGCAQGQGQGQRSHDTRTFLDSWNELLRQ